ncbi:MAG: GAP family protein [Desertimonas sp.]
MGTTIGDILGIAIGVAISPLPIIALILVLLSRNGRTNSLAFSLGWVLGLVALETIVILIDPTSRQDGAADSGGLLQLLIGAVFLILAWKQWQQRPRPGEEPTLPHWMASLDGSTPGRCVGIGFLLGTLNPKNLGLGIAAGTSIATADLPGGQQAIVLAVYVLIASVSIIVPTAAVNIAGDRARPALEALRPWLVQNNAIIMTILFTVLGLNVLGKGLAGTF